MKPHLKRVRDQVIVITGASSGIGLATAWQASRRGAKLVLVSRNEEDLKRIVEGIRRDGGQAEYVVADVAVDSEVQNVADVAIEKFGGFDTWVNNAGVSIYGRLVDIPLDEKKRVFDTNFWGVVHGCKAAVRHLRHRGGAIINIGSEASIHPLPLQGIYAASKHAVKAYSDSLRMELEEEGAPISITLIKPASVNTPYTAHARNHLEEAEPELPAPIYSPEVVARAILACAERPVPSLYVGGAGFVFGTLEQFAPRLTERLGEMLLMRGQRSTRKKVRDEDLTGDSPRRMLRSSLYRSMALHPVTTTLAAAGLGGAILRTARARGSQNRDVNRSVNRSRKKAA